MLAGARRTPTHKVFTWAYGVGLLASQALRICCRGACRNCTQSQATSTTSYKTAMWHCERQDKSRRHPLPMWIASQSPWHSSHSSSSQLIGLACPEIYSKGHLLYFLAPVCQITQPCGESRSPNTPIPLAHESPQHLASCQPSACSRQLGRYECEELFLCRHVRRQLRRSIGRLGLIRPGLRLACPYVRTRLQLCSMHAAHECPAPSMLWSHMPVSRVEHPTHPQRSTAQLLSLCGAGVA